MKKSVLISASGILYAVLFFGFFGNDTARSAPPDVYHPESLQAYFSPEGGCARAIVKELDQAKTSVLVQAYSFTSRPIAKALANAHARGVKVEMIVDPEMRKESRSQYEYLRQAGVPMSLDSIHNLAHNKVMIVDGQTVITGSFNFTTAAEKYNAENLLIIQDKELAARYTANWQLHRAHSEVLN